MDFSTTRYVCGDEERRAVLLAARTEGTTDLNGIDFLEVLDRQLVDTPIEGERQRILLLRAFGSDALDALGIDQLRILGGTRVTPVRVLWVAVLADVTPAAPPEIPDDVRAFLAGLPADDADRTLAIGTDSSGDFSTYRLEIHQDGAPHAAFDPRLAAVEFSFKVECPTDFDCKAETECPPEPRDQPAIDYLAKDYQSFRRLMLDRMRLLAPDWRERNPADVGVALVELLAYVGDRLSYTQDAVATEAYLGTARRRISIRRHARLVDYLMHEGAAARAIAQIEVTGSLTLPAGTRLLTGSRDLPVAVDEAELEETLNQASVFETLHETELHPGHQLLHLYTWDDRECCLPKGATSATLIAPNQAAIEPELAPGDLLLFEEVLGPRTGDAADADPAHRHIVRLTSVLATTDPLHDLPLLEVAWDAADALPFPLCVSAAGITEPISIARGNLVVADHGLTLPTTELQVPEDDRSPFRPLLPRGPLTHAVPLPPEHRDTPAAELTRIDPADALPQARLRDEDSAPWRSRRDLLASFAESPEFVAEIEDDGRARLRFGDGTHGRRPIAGSTFHATWRIGQGSAGNLGAEALSRIARPADQALGLGAVVALRNPLAASGGSDGEPVEQVRRFAPEAFRVQERAVTAEDYARAAERHPEVQRAAARFRWTGSWRTVFVTVDRRGGLPVDDPFEDRLREHLNRFRMAGYDLEIVPPRFLPLQLTLEICIDADHFRGDVARELRQRFCSHLQPDGRRGFFHPDEWTFGQPVYLSRVVAAASEVPGVASVVVRRLHPLGTSAPPELVPADGVLEVAERQVVVLDNDPSFPENGKLELIALGGGR